MLDGALDFLGGRSQWSSSLLALYVGICEAGSRPPMLSAPHRYHPTYYGMGAATFTRHSAKPAA